jgi:hypothetical protein
MSTLKKGESIDLIIEDENVYATTAYQYWYFWNGRFFDIRAVRESAGLEDKIYLMDQEYFTKPETAIKKVRKQLREIVCGRKFHRLLDKAEGLI